MSQETQMAQEPITPDTIDMICRNRSFSDRVPHPEDNHKFILCLKNGHYTVMSCPDRLVFNIYLDRCDETNEPLSSGCDSMPCQYGAKCINLANDAYKCECPPGYFGINCERAPDPCASNPCGNDGFCHSMPNSSPIPYYCTCHDQRAFGMSCDASSEKNPCINNDDESVGTIFQTKIDPNVYVHCHDHRIHLKYCIRKMVQTDDHECIWLDLNKKRSPRRKIVNKSNRKRHSSSL